MQTLAKNGRIPSTFKDPICAGDKILRKSKFRESGKKGFNDDTGCPKKIWIIKSKIKLKVHILIVIDKPLMFLKGVYTIRAFFVPVHYVYKNMILKYGLSFN